MICITRFKGVFLIGLKNYPRKCGENAHHVAQTCLQLWLIPAGAGKTYLVALSLRSLRAHPRRCGENPKNVQTPALDVRLIPAGAGKTHPSYEALPHRRAHPRRCGENYMGADASRAGVGSSPQVRGKQLPLSVVGAAVGLIPAGAGKTHSHSCSE